MFCIYCGSRISDAAEYCHSCGKPQQLRKTTLSHQTGPPQKAPKLGWGLLMWLLGGLLAILTLAAFLGNNDAERNSATASALVASSDGRPNATLGQEGAMKQMADKQLLDSAQKLLAPSNIINISKTNEDEAAMYLREFRRRHPSTRDSRFAKIGDRLAIVTLQRNIQERTAILDTNPPSDDAEIMCRIVVKQSLKVSSTANFQEYSEDSVKYLGSGKFHVQTRVDAQNSFGAKIRSTFECEVQCLDKDHCSVTDLKER